MAFLGVYLFNMGHILRRVYHADLTPNVFWGAINRTLLVCGMALAAKSVITTDAGQKAELAFFAIGFLANYVMLGMLDRTATLLRIQVPGNVQPLTLIRGVNLWNESRLEEEGIENVQQLSTCDVVELAINTRYTLRTLVDWVDQAILLRTLGDKAQVLRDRAFVTGAIELAASAQSHGGKLEVIKAIADVLDVSAALVASTMESLAEDEYVRMLWALWQSNLESRNHNGGEANRAERGPAQQAQANGRRNRRSAQARPEQDAERGRVSKVEKRGRVL